MDSETENLTPAELKQLHGLYRKTVTRYTLLSKALRKLSIDEDQLLASVDDSWTDAKIIILPLDRFNKKQGRMGGGDYIRRSSVKTWYQNLEPHSC